MFRSVLGVPRVKMERWNTAVHPDRMHLIQNRTPNARFRNNTNILRNTFFCISTSYKFGTTIAFKYFN